MAIVTLNKSEVKKIIGSLSDEKLEEIISMFGVPVEKITENEIEVEIAPNRPDMLSCQGVYRAMESYFKNKIKKYSIEKSSAKIIVDKSVEKIRPFSMAAIVKGVKFTDEKIKEIMQWQEKMHSTLGRNRKKVALGYYILDKIKFPVRYIAKEPKEIVFEPLDMPTKMNALQILSKHPCGREYGNQLEGFKRFPVYYDSNNEVLSLPPIINSNNSGKITAGISDVLIECSGTDLETLKKVISMAVIDLIDQGGEAYSIEVSYGKNKEAIDLTPEKLKIRIKDAEKLLGIKLSEKEVKKLLSKMGYNYSKETVEIPAYRADILHPVDIYEDIAIAYGYDKFVPEIPEISTIGKEEEIEIKKRKIAEILCGLGLLEISTYHLTTKEDIKKTLIKEKTIEVLNSKTDFNILRPNLLVNALRILSENTDAKYPQKLFEIGRTFEDEKEIEEKEKLCIAISGETDFTEIKQTLDYLMRMLNKEYKIQETTNPVFIEGRCGEIMVDGKEIGFLGEISPTLIKNWGLKMPTVALEMEIEVEHV